ncbi:ATP synthase subunit I [Phocicoccus pinnipedialis]|uniref:ATP synthase I chain n=1 Tax=Phocicoccus pinnipedialis TaxID=110845 RepID=A0A6V7R4X1_9BACL|nr:ATP synthase subunit I [Jeotgalicoccus pinnipedialis]MBP1939939.1 ATP synthase protein I [Jeotgalicoccus pinnipedialis]CAD2072113.1 ATP synthase I chain [Jeotgalicoccus pinnipedialis]
MTVFKAFLRHFVIYFAIFMLIFLAWYFITKSSIALGLILGTVISIFMAFSWYVNLRRAYDEDETNIRTGSATRIILVILACVIWYKFNEYINIFGVLFGLLLTYILILYHATTTQIFRKR